MNFILSDDLGQHPKLVHGSPYDRGSADRYYGRSYDPHYYPNGTYNDPKITPSNGMTTTQVAEYARGFNEETDRKDYG